SLGDDSEGRKFLAQLFGRRSEGFTFVQGDLDQPEGADHLDGLAHALLEPDAEQTLLPSDGTLQRSLTRAMTENGVIRPLPISTVASRLFPSLPVDNARKAFDRLTSLLESIDEPPVRLRGHLFFRTLQGIWACSNPDCSSVPAPFRAPNRRIGKLYASPRFTCDCGSRVLELLYCQSCGESMLGGYVARAGTREFLVSAIA